MTTNLIERIKLINKPKLQHIEDNDLNLDYGPLFDKSLSSDIFSYLEANIRYFDGPLSQVKVYGQYYPIPRKQVAFGDPGLTYTFSSVKVPALQWDPVLLAIRQQIASLFVCEPNFVLVNRYNDGLQHIGYHRDNESDLDHFSPIISLSLGAEREFIFRHEQKMRHTVTDVADDVKLLLEDGSILFLNYPTNKHWYHTLPIRRKVSSARINLTFRTMKKKTA